MSLVIHRTELLRRRIARQSFRVQPSFLRRPRPPIPPEGSVHTCPSGLFSFMFIKVNGAPPRRRRVFIFASSFLAKIAPGSPGTRRGQRPRRRPIARAAFHSGRPAPPALHGHRRKVAPKHRRPRIPSSPASPPPSRSRSDDRVQGRQQPLPLRLPQGHETHRDQTQRARRRPARLQRSHEPVGRPSPRAASPSTIRIGPRTRRRYGPAPPGVAASARPWACVSSSRSLRAGQAAGECRPGRPSPARPAARPACTIARRCAPIPSNRTAATNLCTSARRSAPRPSADLVSSRGI